MTELICPKCHAAMRTYERNGVHIEQCTECRGIFLDKGELEHLSTAEAKWQAAPSAPPMHSGGDFGAPEPYYRRRKSFFEELFD